MPLTQRRSKRAAAWRPNRALGSQVLAELRTLQAYREPLVGSTSQILAIGLSSRKNMCVHPKAREAGAVNLPSPARACTVV